MKLVLTVFLFVVHVIAYGNTHIINNPIFDRCDIPEFRVCKIKVGKDTTYVYCSYCAEKESWANISKDTYLENVSDGTRHRIIKATGLPLAPKKIYFDRYSDIQVVLYFPHVSATKINIIEDINNESFNIYGINLHDDYHASFTLKEYDFFLDQANKNKDNGNIDLAIINKEKQLEASKYLFGINSIYCGSIAYDLCLLHFQKKDYSKAIEYGETAISIIKKTPEYNFEDIARIESSLMTSHVLLGQYDKAAMYGDMSLKKRRHAWGEVPELAVYLDYLARIYYYTMGNPARALIYELESSDIFLKSQGQYSDSYIQTLTNLSVFYNELGNNEKSLFTAERAINLRKDSLDRRQVGIYHNYSVALIANGKYDLALEYIHKNQELLSLINKSKSYEMIESLTLEGDCHRHMKNFELSLFYYDKAIRLNNSLITNYNKQYVHLLFKKSQIHSQTYRHEESLYCDSLAMDICKKIYGNNIYYAEAACRYTKSAILNKIFFNKEINDSIFHFIVNSSNIIKKHINESMYNLLSNERFIYWQEYMHLFDDFIPAIAYILEADTLNALAYDASLYSKGFLLGIEKELRNNVLEDNCLSDSIKDLTYCLNIRNQLLSHNDSTTFHELNRINQIIENKERILLKNLQIKGKFLPLYPSWKNVQNKLSNEDVAIEFLAFDYSADSTLYYALLINNTVTHPKLIKLFDEKSLKESLADSKDKTSFVLRFVWGPLIKEITGKKNVFFSPSRLLNTIAFEHVLPLELEGTNIYRLSSTKELCKKKQTEFWNYAALFGGMDYNNETEKDSISANEKISSIRASYDYLPQTLDEIVSIRNILYNKHIKCWLYDNKNGTESKFDSLQNADINILHIASHGMYATKDISSKKKAETSLPFFDVHNKTSFEEEALNRSFLLLSGGNRKLYRNNDTNSSEDGILTALEISLLNFKKLDLVVLSACHTGEGDICSEGVYGLQRGFKKAGANTILMSLGKVDDEATKLLMVEFYRNLINGKTKHQSLKDAQLYLRTVENGKYNDPKYWASFIMLDGIN